MTLRVRRSAVERLAAAASTALPAQEAVVARQVLADDLALLACLDAQIAAAEAKIAKLLPETPFAVSLTCRAGAPYEPPTTAPRSATRVGGQEPASSTAHPVCPRRSMTRLGKGRDGTIGRQGSVALRRALIDLGIGLWHADPAARRYGQQLRARGKNGGVIGCAMANRANKIAYAMVRDQSCYDPARRQQGRPSTPSAWLDMCHRQLDQGQPAAVRQPGRGGPLLRRRSLRRRRAALRAEARYLWLEDPLVTYGRKVIISDTDHYVPAAATTLGLKNPLCATTIPSS